MGYAGLDLAGKVAVVVGGTSGVGLAIAIAMAEAGADVVPTSRRREQTEAAAKKIAATGRRSLAVTADVCDKSSLEHLLHVVVRDFGRVDILVNSAGRTMRAPTLDFPDQEWDRIMDTNLVGLLHSCQIFGRHMIERQCGRIINIASIASLVAMQEVAAYCASKAAVAALTKSLAIEWAPHGVCVNAIAPGVFLTSINQALVNETPRGQEFLLRTPMKRFGRLEELAGAAIFLASDSASFVTGTVLVIDGGLLASGNNQ